MISSRFMMCSNLKKNGYISVKPWIEFSSFDYCLLKLMYRYKSTSCYVDKFTFFQHIIGYKPFLCN